VDKATLFIASVYSDLLGRLPERGGLDHYRIVVGNGQTPAARLKVAQEIIASQEYRRALLQKLYQRFLKRSADASGLATYSQYPPWDEGKITIELLSSQEYWQNHGSTCSDYVTGLYQDLFGHDPDPGGKQFWTNECRLNGGFPNGARNVAQRNYSSDEGRMHLVILDYSTLLRRLPDPSGLPYYATRLKTDPNDVVIAEILSSAEYFKELPRASGAP
jgi:hypothetical protein